MQTPAVMRASKADGTRNMGPADQVANAGKAVVDVLALEQPAGRTNMRPRGNQGDGEANRAQQVTHSIHRPFHRKVCR